MRSTALPIVVVFVAVFAVLFGAVNAAQCNYDSCADCLCQVTDYGSRDRCTNAGVAGTTGCIWCDSTSTCMEAGSTCDDPIVRFSSSPTPDDDDFADHPDYLNCTIGVAPGALAVVCLFLSLAVVFTIISARFKFCTTRQFKDQDTMWLQTILRSHVPAGETIEWLGTSNAKPPQKVGAVSWLLLQLLSIAPMTLPSIIWLLIGLPNVLSSNTFGFYFPVCFVGGLGTFFNLMAWLSICGNSASANLVMVYALTPQHAIVAKGLQNVRRQTAITCTAISGGVTRLSVVGNSVTFHSHGSMVSFDRLEDTGPVFLMLQERTSSGGAPSAVTTRGAMGVLLANNKRSVA